ncbi:MAG: nitroreductase family protein [Candidatus Eisenbacteria bacterium]|uniref:Nitroreductase family protein n=1 Tax=Eiseniibacteriota bacterium TaxID=2212470 RepID=A0A948RTL9_UNCEI|nr:nitroreductase family protein [Candidatus Eisenbacteria bacterium]MBU1947858.1 nitroreductase family protein [Candidatus Eisenbacteria bacterium]MBU2690783.1 nitroreductase family protein [Candidatus Eisenbacteria bacterium]
MEKNPMIDILMNRKSVRSFKEEAPSQEVIETIFRAGQQAPFAMQLCSAILERGEGIPWGAPLNFIICADAHRMRLIAKKRGRRLLMNDLTMLLFALQDAAYMAQNMVIAGEALGLGSCYIGSAPMIAGKIVEQYKLPPKVFPMVMLVMGYPAENKPVRPRYPLSFSLFENEYPSFTDEQVTEAMRVMDEGYLAQDYYKEGRLMIKMEEGKEETSTFDDYSWTEHISRKFQWFPLQSEILESLKACGFKLGSDL